MTNLSLIAVNQYGVITAIQEKLQRRCHILRRNCHKRIFVGGKGNLKVLDAVLLQKVNILRRIILGDKSPLLY